MTFKEKLQMEHPELVNEDVDGYEILCPDEYGYEEVSPCNSLDGNCIKCWNREMPDKETSEKEFNIATQGYSKGYSVGKDDGYTEGLNDAWELAKKINVYKEDGGLTMSELGEIFDETDTCKIMCLSYEEALAKLKAYEEQSVVKRGDCVKANGEYHHFYGIYLGKDERGWTWILSNNDIAPQRIRDDWKLEKTGEHVDLDSILEQIGE